MVMQDASNYLEIERFLPRPIFKKLASAVEIKSAKWIKMGGGLIHMGLDDPEGNDKDHQKEAVPFGWDNEGPCFQKTVDSFDIQSRPVTISEYLGFLDSLNWKEDMIPSSWIQVGNEWMVRSLYGSISLEKTLLWPVSTSHYQASCYASHFGWRLPSEAELVFSKSVTPNSLNDNHSFARFCPNNVDLHSPFFTDAVGSGWEWTSTVFEPFENFQASKMYPGYSADFL